MNKSAKILLRQTPKSGFVTLVASNGRPVMTSDAYHSRFNAKRAKGDIINAMVSALRAEGFRVDVPTTPFATTKRTTPTTTRR